MMVRLLGVLTAALLLAACPRSAATVMAATQPVLILDPPRLDLGTVDGAKAIHATLLIRNISDQPAMIASLTSSCGCTDLQAEAMALPAGGFTQLHVTIDPFAKQGDITKKVTVHDPFGGQSSATITLRVHPDPHAAASKRSLFDGKCASCHFDPVKGLHQGNRIYQAVCAMCHGEEGNGAYAPKLRGLDKEVLTTIIRNGAGTLAMPAFARQHGGPLSSEQIRALVDWLR